MYGIAQDTTGNLYVCGWTDSDDFPTTQGAYDSSYNGDGDCFVAKFGTTGSLLWSTYIGSGSAELPYALAVDASGDVVIVGKTDSDAFPTTQGAEDETHNGTSDGFVTKFDAAGDLLWSTYLGGFGNDACRSVVTDATRNVCVAGFTESATFPTTEGAFDTSQNGLYDAFILKLDPDGALDWSTFWGSTDGDYAYGITVDTTGDIAITGLTYSATFPMSVTAAIVTSVTDEGDLLVAKFSASGQHLWSSVIGADGLDKGSAITVDSTGNLFVVGTTRSELWFSVGGYCTSPNGDSDAFVAQFDRFGALVASTYLGGEEEDVGSAVVVDASQNLFVTMGRTFSNDLSTSTEDYGGGGDTFVAKFVGMKTPTPTFTDTPTPLESPTDTPTRTPTGTPTETIVVSGGEPFVMQYYEPTPNPTLDIDVVSSDNTIWLMWPWVDDPAYPSPTPVIQFQFADPMQFCQVNCGLLDATPSLVTYQGADYWTLELGYSDYAAETMPEMVQTAIAEGTPIAHNCIDCISPDIYLYYADCGDATDGPEGGIRWVTPTPTGTPTVTPSDTPSWTPSDTPTVTPTNT